MNNFYEITYNWIKDKYGNEGLAAVRFYIALAQELVDDDDDQTERVNRVLRVWDIRPTLDDNSGDLYS